MSSRPRVMKRILMKNRAASTAAAAGACFAAVAAFCNRLASRRQCPLCSTDRLFYYSKNAHRADAFKLLEGNYLVARNSDGRRRSVANITSARSAPHPFVCARSVRGAARYTAPEPALNLDDAMQHMADRRPIVTDDSGSITTARHRSETKARGRCSVANRSP